MMKTNQEVHEALIDDLVDEFSDLIITGEALEKLDIEYFDGVGYPNYDVCEVMDLVRNIAERAVEIATGEASKDNQETYTIKSR